jgi:hypothetical protein
MNTLRPIIDVTARVPVVRKPPGALAMPTMIPDKVKPCVNEYLIKRELSYMPRGISKRAKNLLRFIYENSPNTFSPNVISWAFDGDVVVEALANRTIASLVVPYPQTLVRVAASPVVKYISYATKPFYKEMGVDPDGLLSNSPEVQNMVNQLKLVSKEVPQSLKDVYNLVVFHTIWTAAGLSVPTRSIMDACHIVFLRNQ